MNDFLNTFSTGLLLGVGGYIGLKAAAWVDDTLSQLHYKAKCAIRMRSARRYMDLNIHD